jgi:Sec-independent protein secretion pathway component TatC
MLVQYGIIPAQSLVGKKKLMIYFALFIVLNIITPDPTPITATIILIPFIVIFEVAALAAKRIDEGHKKTGYPYEPPKVGGIVCKFCGGKVLSSFCTVCNKSQI